MTAAEVLSRIREKRAEEARLLAILDLWAAVQAQGIDIGSVACFGMDPRLLTKRERLERQQAARAAGPDWRAKPTHSVQLRAALRRPDDTALSVVEGGAVRGKHGRHPA